jgi:hypothetical protein
MLKHGKFECDLDNAGPSLQSRIRIVDLAASFR